MNDSFTFEDAKKFAEGKGYTCHDTSALHETWTKQIVDRMGTDDFLFLTINKAINLNEAILERIFGLVTCKINSFSIPNKNFEIFESMLTSLVQIKEMV